MVQSRSLRIQEIMLDKTTWEKVLDRVDLKNKMPLQDRLAITLLLETGEYKALVNQLLAGEYKWSVPEKLLLAKAGTTKKRVVYMYSNQDRVFLSVLFKAMNEVFEDTIAPNCFSYRRGINTSSAIKHIAKDKQSFDKYGVKLDISAYFNSVSKAHLMKCIYKLFPNQKEEPLLQAMLDLFDNDTVTYKGVEIQEYKALIPGCALGSFFANYCLRDIDNYFLNKEVTYARYSDDIILLSSSKENNNEYLQYIKTKIKEYGLTINDKKYVHFEPNEPIEYLGLSLSERGIDISNNAKRKLKKTIHRWVKKARKDIEVNGKPFDKVARSLVNRLNWKIYKSYLIDPRKFGWGYYVFRYVTDYKSLTEIDFYLRDQLRYLKTGKHNKANIKSLDDNDFMSLGVLSLYDMCLLFHEDFNKYQAVIDTI